MALRAFRELSVEAFVHATESEARVEQAVRAVAGGAKVERQALGGHFGQPLVRLTAVTREPAAIERAVSAIAAAHGAEVVRTVDRRISRDLVLHLRVEKQAAFLGTLRLSDASQGDVLAVRFRLRAPRLTPQEAAELVQQAFGAPAAKAEEE
jgi:RNA binding exosome subunit